MSGLESLKRHPERRLYETVPVKAKCNGDPRMLGMPEPLDLCQASCILYGAELTLKNGMCYGQQSCKGEFSCAAQSTDNSILSP